MNQGVIFGFKKYAVTYVQVAVNSGQVAETPETRGRMGYMVESFIFGSKRVVISKLSSFQEKNYCIAENLAGIKLIWRFQPKRHIF